jgi:hypothetical protein
MEGKLGDHRKESLTNQLLVSNRFKGHSWLNKKENVSIHTVRPPFHAFSHLPSLFSKKLDFKLNYIYNKRK